MSIKAKEFPGPWNGGSQHYSGGWNLNYTLVLNDKWGKKNFYNTLVELGKNEGYQTKVQQHFLGNFATHVL